MQKKLQCTALAFLLVTALFAQTTYQWKEGSADGYSYRYVAGDPMKARIYTLKNGLTVMLSVNRKEPRIQTLIGVRAGSNHDPKEHTGLAHYLEHLLFKGTYRYGTLDSAKESHYLLEIENLYESYNKTTEAITRKRIYRQIDSLSGIAARYAIANEYDKMMTAIGAQGTNAHTWVEETIYKENIPTSSVDQFLAVQAERFRKPVFRLFHTELEAVYEEKNRGLDNDNTQVWETALGALFPTHNYGQQTTIGTIEHLKNPSLKAIRQYYNTYYRPNNMALVMVGDLDPEETIKKIDRAFSYMQPGTIPQYRAAAEAPIQKPITREVYGPDAESVLLTFRMPGGADHQSSVLLTLVNQILSNGKTGLIDLNINRQQKVLSAGASTMSWKDYAVFALSGKPRQGQTLEEVKDLLQSQLEILRKGAFEESILKAIVSNYKFFELQGLENNNNRAESLMDGFIKHRGELWLEEVRYIDEMSKVTKKQVVDFVNRYLDENYVLLYKRKGENKNTVKVEKPPITPIEVNREAQSPFLAKVLATPPSPVKPQWLDYSRDLQRSTLGVAPFYAVQNKDNAIFRFHYRFPMGTWHNKLLPLAATYLQYLGTSRYSSEEISRQFYALACNFSINTGNEETTITLTGLQENFDQALSLFEHLLTACKADEKALEALKNRYLKSRADAKLNKANIMRGLTAYATYGAQNPFNHTLSNEELKGVAAGQLVSLLQSLFSYPHSLIYYGPETAAGAKARIQKGHTISPSFSEVPKGVVFAKRDQVEPEVFLAHYDMVQAEVQWVYNGERFNPAQMTTVDLFNNYFGGGMGSIVFQTIRESKALAYSTYAVYFAPGKKDDRYTTLAYVGSQWDKIKEAIGGMNELLQQVPESKKAFVTAQKSLKQDLETDRITGDNIVFSYISARKMGFETDYRINIYNDIEKLSFGDIHRFHQSHVAGKPYTYCVLASETKVKSEDLQAYGKVKKLTLSEIFGY